MKASGTCLSLCEVRAETDHLSDHMACLIPVVVRVSDPEDSGNEIMQESTSNRRNDQIVLDVDHADLKADQLVLDVSDSLLAHFRSAAVLAEFVMDLAEQETKSKDPEKDGKPTALAQRAMDVLEKAGYDTETTPLKMQAASRPT